MMIDGDSNASDLPTGRKHSAMGNNFLPARRNQQDPLFTNHFDLGFSDPSMLTMSSADLVNDSNVMHSPEQDALSYLSGENTKPVSLFPQTNAREHDTSQFMFKNSADTYDISEDLNMEMFANSPTSLFSPDSHDMSLDISQLYTSSISSSPSSSPSSCAEIKQEHPPSKNDSLFLANPSDPSTPQPSSVPYSRQKTPVSISDASSTSPSINTAILLPQAPEPVKIKREFSEALTNYQFGRELPSTEPIPQPNHLPQPPPTNGWKKTPVYMPDFDPTDWQDTSQLKYQLQVQDVPSKSRVETQIRVLLNFYPPPSETIVHLPADTISKPKLQLRTPFTPIPSALSIDTVVVCDSDLSRYVDICQGCMKRERKRAFRKKVRLPIEEAHWQQDKEKRVIVFNCREVIDFGPLVDIQVDGQTVQSRQLELPMRMACYCRHHNEKNGFRAFFVVRDHQGTIVARGSTQSIMITDDHKAANVKTSNGVKRSNSDIDVQDSIAISEHTSPAANDELLFNVLALGSQPVTRKRKTGDPNITSQVSSFPIPKNDKKRPMAISQCQRSTATSPQTFSPISTPTFEFALQSPVSPRPNSLSYKRTSSIDNLGAIMSRPISAIPSPGESPVNILSPPKQSVDDWIAQDTKLPAIQRIIPASGSIRGGIEVTLLGTGFIDSLVAKFGENKSMSNHWWNNATIVTTLPPSRFPGPVVVTFEGFAMPDPQVFSYYDDTDRQLIELALQVVGLKMNGRLEDARDIARRIVGSGTGFDPSQVQQLRDTAGAYNRATGLSLDNLDTLLLKCLELIDSYDSEHSPNYQLSNAEGQTMLHLSACLGLNLFTSELLSRGIKSLDNQDKNGFTPLHFAALHHRDDLVTKFLEHGAYAQQRTYNGLNYTQLRESTGSVISQSSYEFNDDSNCDSDETSENGSGADDTSFHTQEDQPDITHRLTSFLASWRDAAVSRITSPMPQTTDSDSDNANLFDRVYPNTGQISQEDEGSAESSLPPSYDEIFPAGASSSQDFSRAAIDDDKTATPINPHVEQGEVEPSEDEVLEAWKNKRKKIQNDRMFLFFWLPVFIFMLVWLSMKAVAFFDGVDASAQLHAKASTIINGLLGIKEPSQTLSTEVIHLQKSPLDPVAPLADVLT